MYGIIDVGGGMRAVYTSGIYDSLMDKGIAPEYCIGVSAGSANLITYIAGQRGRTKRFYLEYAQRNEYMGLRLMLKKHIYFDLDYVYAVLSNSDGEDPLDIAAAKQSGSSFYAVATNAKSGKTEYFGLDKFEQDNYNALKASCAIPLACSPIKVGNSTYFDGGVSEPIPYKKAFEDGCDKVIVILTKPASEPKKKMPVEAALRTFKGKYPETAKAILSMHEKYNNALKEVRELEKQGKALIVSPDSCCKVTTASRNVNNLNRLYEKGYASADKIIDFIK